MARNGGPVSLRPSSRPTPERQRHAEAIGQSRIDAATRLRRLRQRIGPEAYALVIAVVAEDRPWREIGRRLGVAGRDREERGCLGAGADGRAGLSACPQPAPKFVAVGKSLI